jgi:regulator of cell morphogenesis and NO signaling
MEHEHDSAGRTLEMLRQVTGNYRLPDDACPTFAAMYDELQQLEADLHQHIHLENNILFPRAMELEG